MEFDFLSSSHFSIHQKFHVYSFLPFLWSGYFLIFYLESNFNGPTLKAELFKFKKGGRIFSLNFPPYFLPSLPGVTQSRRDSVPLSKLPDHWPRVTSENKWKAVREGLILLPPLTFLILFSKVGKLSKTDGRKVSKKLHSGLCPTCCYTAHIWCRIFVKQFRCPIQDCNNKNWFPIHIIKFQKVTKYKYHYIFSRIERRSVKRMEKRGVRSHSGRTESIWKSEKMFSTIQPPLDFHFFPISSNCECEQK